MPLFSPDGHWVGFVVGTKLYKISVEGGAAVTIGDVSGPHVAGAQWGEEGSLLVSEAFGGPGIDPHPRRRGSTRDHHWNWAARKWRCRCPAAAARRQGDHVRG